MYLMTSESARIAARSFRSSGVNMRNRSRRVSISINDGMIQSARPILTIAPDSQPEEKMTTEERFRKIEAGIGDLIVVSRTVLNSIEQLAESVGGLRGSVEELRGSVDELREAPKHTDEKL